MRNKFAALFLVSGIVLILGALSLYTANRQQNSQAGKQSDEYLSSLLLQIESSPEDTAQKPPENSRSPTAPPSPEASAMKEVVIDGNACIGYLTIPALELELPILSQWSYDKLQIAPCRYTGTITGNDLVLLAHNYAAHFGRISALSNGDTVIFTDMDGIEHRYAVVRQEVLDAMAVEKMTAGEYALSLFTCTYDSESRIAVRCVPANPSASCPEP